MLDNKGFDNWAGSYDEDIANSKGYPFEGYYNVLGVVHNLVEKPKGKKILDIGIGTGALTNELYRQGAIIYGVDFSQRMIKEAELKMPEGKFYYCDVTKGLPREVMEIEFDYVVSSYAIHHLTDEEKLEFISKLKKIIKKEGKIILADVAFKTYEDQEQCKIDSGDEWDSDEFYLVLETFDKKLQEIGLKYNYRQISMCGGVLELFE